MHAPLTTERQKYHHLYSLVCEDLPTKAVDALVRKGHKATTEELRAVRQSHKPQAAPDLAYRPDSYRPARFPNSCPVAAGSDPGPYRCAPAGLIKAILSPFTSHTCVPQHRPRAGPAQALLARLGHPHRHAAAARPGHAGAAA